jgi:hypothetical protein
VLVNRLGVLIACERHPDLVEVCDIALKPDPAHEKDCDTYALVPEMRQEDPQ